MKRGKILLILLLAFAVLGGAFFFISRNAKPEEVYTPSSEELGFTCLSIPLGNIETMSWVCDGKDGDFSFRNLGEIWEYIPDDSLELDNDYMNQLAGMFANLTAYRELDWPDKPSDYGFDEPFLTVNITVVGGGQYDIIFGNMTSVAGRRYVATGNGKVYTVSSSVASAFNYELGNIVNTPESEE